MGKRKVKGSPATRAALSKVPKIHTTSRNFQNCVTNQIDTLIEEVKTMLKGKDQYTYERKKSGPLSSFFKPKPKNKGEVGSKATVVPIPGAYDNFITESGTVNPLRGSFGGEPLCSSTTYEIPCANCFLPLGTLDDLPGTDKVDQGVQISCHLPIQVPFQEDMGNAILNLREEISELRQMMEDVLNLLRQTGMGTRNQGTQTDCPAPTLSTHETESPTLTKHPQAGLLLQDHRRLLYEIFDRVFRRDSTQCLVLKRADLANSLLYRHPLKSMARPTKLSCVMYRHFRLPHVKVACL
ncbi:hypothetical protein NDU88_006052 [Pleurodeles waltl]|uniref:Uncharacterized protein n=1 Tax=Pleurodeles waltl TaxID=8319 RepID=A0AAV7VLT0_PLEWA|nr:hypothetical protein NDU88_006052 [Pleurodeles waltl]